MLISIINLLIIMIPAIAMVAGLSLSVFVPLFLILVVAAVWKPQISFDFNSYKLELVFLSWLLLCCFWSPNVFISLKSWLKVICLLLASYIAITNIKALTLDRPKLSSNLFLAITLPLAIFLIEINSHGTISLFIAKFIKGQEDPAFYLYIWDRGITMLGLFSWVIIGILLKHRSFFLVTLFYFFVLSIALVSDSLATAVGFAFAGIVFLLVRYFALFRNPRFTSAIFILLSILMLVGFYFMDPMKISNENNFLPLSAKHRIFIWHYVADHSADQLLYGHGFDSSKAVHIPDADMIEYAGQKLSPLPLHPHNGPLQILFETGLIGLVLYFMLITKYLSIISIRREATQDNWQLNLIAIKYAFFANYIIICFVSYSMWRFWWLACQAWVVFMFYLASYYYFEPRSENK